MKIRNAVSGTAIFPALEGTRPVLVEIQALTVRLASGATPRRAAVGWDSGRLAMILAVLEARCGMSFATVEVYLNVAGGYRLTDPAADLAVASALVSAMSERSVPQSISRTMTLYSPNEPAWRRCGWSRSRISPSFGSRWARNQRWRSTSSRSC